MLELRWTWPLPVIFVAAYLVADTASVLAKGRLEAVPLDEVHVPPPAESTRPPVPLRAFLRRNLFDAEVGTKPAGPKKPSPSTTGCVAASGHSLSATIVSVDAKRSRAVVDGEQLALGDPIGEATVTAIQRRRVVLERGGACELLGLDAAPPRPNPVTPKKPIARRGVVTRNEIDETLNNLPVIARDARIVPRFEKGQPVGFALLRIRRGSLYERLGLENGDVVRHVDGYDIANTKNLFGLTQKVLSKEEVTVDIVRRGQKKTLTVRIE